MNVRSMLRWLPLCVLLLLPARAARAQQEEKALPAVPADSLAYISLDPQGLQRFWTELRASALAKAARQVADTPARQAQMQQTEERVTQVLAALVATVDGRAGVALADAKLTPGQAPPYLGVFPTRGQDQAQALAAALRLVLTQGNAEPKSRDYQGVTITSFPRAKAGAPEPATAVVGGRVLVAAQGAILEKAIDTAAGRTPSLMGKAGFERVRARLAANSDVWSWLDQKRYAARILEMWPAVIAAAKEKARGAPAPTFNPDALKPLLDFYSDAGARLRFSSPGILLDGFYVLNGDSEIGKTLLSQETGPLRPAALASSQPALFLALRNLPAVAGIYRTILDASGFAPQFDKGYQEMLAQIKKETGVDLQRDFLAYIGSEAALVVNDLPPGGTTVPALLYLQTTDRLAQGTTLQRLRQAIAKSQGPKFEEKQLPQGRIYFVDLAKENVPFRPGWTFAGDFLVFGDRDALKTPLYLSQSMGVPFSTTPGYQNATAWAGNRLLAAVYLDADRLVTLVSKVAPDLAKGPAMAPRLALIRALGTLWQSADLETDSMSVRMEWKPALNP